MYVQKLPKPSDLMAVPTDDFQNIDDCVIGKTFEDLNDKEYVSDGKSHCLLWQEWEKTLGVWRYNCTAVQENGCLANR